MINNLIFIHLQEQFEDYRRKLEVDIQQHLKKQGDELKMLLQMEVLKIREMFFTLENENIESHKQLLSREEEGVGTSVTTATNDLKRPGRESKGTYENWDFDDNEVFDLIPVSEIKEIFAQVDKLDVTVKADKIKGMALIYQLMTTSESITVTKNRRFPVQGRYYNRGCRIATKYQCSALQSIYYFLEFIDNDYTDDDYDVLKSLILNKFAECSNDEGFVGEYAFKCATRDVISVVKPFKHPLLEYLSMLCYFVNIEKMYSGNGLRLPNVVSFEKEYGLTWKEFEQ